MLISQNEGCAGGSLGFGFWLCRVSASVHWVFGVLVSILHNWGVLWGVGTGVFGDPVCGGWDVGGAEVRNRGFYLHTL